MRRSSNLWREVLKSLDLHQRVIERIPCEAHNHKTIGFVRDSKILSVSGAGPPIHSRVHECLTPGFWSLLVCLHWCVTRVLYVMNIISQRRFSCTYRLIIVFSSVGQYEFKNLSRVLRASRQDYVQATLRIKYIRC